MIVQAAHGAHQSMLEPAGVKAGMVASFWHFLWITSAIVFVVVMAVLAYALFHRRRSPAPESAETQRRVTRWVIASVATTFAVIVVFLVVNFRLGQAEATRSAGAPLLVNVIGHQWWWEFQYPDSAHPSNWITTANELHIPVGRPVVLAMQSPDVIHSFWVPNLSGKKDLVPGRITETWIEADSAGVYRGQCAEFCGEQHAKMAMLVIAEPQLQFEAWANAQREEAAKPADSLALARQQVFMAGSCSLCHAISGMPAGSHVGPDLSHLASRRTLAAASVPNNRGNLAGWILDPQSIKPGTQMPPNALQPDQLRSLLAYLEGLK